MAHFNASDRKARTSLDVAKLANVSSSTVSLVMNGKADGRVSRATQERVLRAAEDLGYRPSLLAQSFRRGQLPRVALVVANVANPFFAPVLRGVQLKARQERYAVLLLETNNDPDLEKQVWDAIPALSLDCCIICAAGPMEESVVEQLCRHVVLIEAVSPSAASVLIDVGGGARTAIQHLIEIGHERIAYFAADYDKETFRLRFAAYRRVLESEGIAFRPEYVRRARFDIDPAFKAALQLLQVSPPPTAVFCEDDLLAAAIYKAARTLGLEIPHDLSVVGFDDIELARMLEPELTTVAIPAMRLGEEAMSLMFDLIRGFPPSVRNLPLEFRVRGSTASPRTR